MVLGIVGRGTASTVMRSAASTSVTVSGCGMLVLNQGKGGNARVRYDDAGHAAIVRDYATLVLNDRLGTLAGDSRSRTRTITDPQKAGLLRTIAGAHSDEAFDWAVANFALFNSFLKASARAAFVPLLRGQGRTIPPCLPRSRHLARRTWHPKRAPVSARRSPRPPSAAPAADRLAQGPTAWLAGGR